jgi:hypothetical protein
MKITSKECKVKYKWILDPTPSCCEGTIEIDQVCKQVCDNNKKCKFLNKQIKKYDYS